MAFSPLPMTSSIQCVPIIAVAVASVLLVAANAIDQQQDEQGACSRSCGGGIAYKTVGCPSDRSGDISQCVPTRSYVICNTQECPDGTGDYQDLRKEQCSRYDSEPFSGQLYTWKPYLDVANKCQLFCSATGADGERLYHKFADNVINGTPCDRTGNSICVDGACLPIWCDGSVGGIGKKNDACLECGGDGKDCVTEHGTVDTQELTQGYHELFIVPEGATSILVREDGPSNNYIAVRDAEGNYYLNGDGEIALYPESIEMAGTVFEYQRHNGGIEYLSADGPLQQALIFELVKRSAQGASVGYEYSLKEALHDPFTWVASAWTSCNASCGDGWLNRDVRCISSETGEVVDDSYCSPDTKLKSTQFCNHGNCTGSWKTGEWSSCSAACGTGIETRAVGCEERYDDAESVDTEMCDEKLRPEHTRQCDTEIPCHQWSTGPWSKCSQECGTGEQTRQVRCSAQHNDTHSVSGTLPDSYCDVRIRPAERQACNDGPCNGAEWLTSGWSGCQCSGTETRTVLCINKDGHVLHNDQCDLSTQPSTSQHCTPAHDDPLCTKIAQHWFTSQWSKCSAKCGHGRQKRHVFCGSLIDDVITVLPSSDCVADEQPAATQECSVQDCVGEWFAAPFGKCSAACGGGKRHRTLMCYIGNKLAGESDCENGARPYATEDCNVQPCDDDHLIVVNPKGCRDSPHGCCSDGVTAAEGPDNLGCLASNDPIPDGTCIETEYGCCPDGVTVAQGPSFKGCETHSCRDSRYGCCPDGETPATGEDNYGCEVEEELIVPVTYPKLGDGESHLLPTESPEVEEELIVPVTFHKLGDGESHLLPTESPEVEEELIVAVTHRNLGDGELCFESAYGCCADMKTLKQGPNGEGCSEFQQAEEGGSGEVDDFIPPPQSVDVEGAAPPSFPPSTDDGSESSGEPDCQSSQFGCCSDGVTSARGPDGSGCEVNTELKPESGCARSTYGCCIDGVSAASGPQFVGCRSESDRNYRPSCKDEPYGCCPDGQSAAAGPEYAGCPHRIYAAAVCSLPKEKGSCANLTIQWYYDGAYGDCQRFWYSGCEGNANRFETREQCRNQCISPPEDSFQRCFLPHTGGRCRDTRYRYYYNHEQSKCEEFIYGGCLGNDNNFETIDQCQNTCIEPLKPNICRQPAQRGPCNGSYKRWYFDYERDSCMPFVYGGCLGNDNRFDSLEECEGRCVAAAVQICSLEKDPGPCDATFYRWHFDVATGQCQEFVFGGCRGNANKFLTRAECEHTCEKLIQRKTINRCNMLPDTGKCKAHYQRWYFDRNDGYCKQFVYGGCGGNENRFDSEPHCRETCNAHTPVDVCLVPAEVTTQCSADSPAYHFDSHVGQCVEYATGTCARNANKFDSMESCRKTCAAHLSSTVSDIPTNERCLLPRDPGPCLAAMIRWHYSTMDGRCVRFEYGGCGGNKNRFLTEEICNTECQPATTTPLPTSPAPTIPSIPEDNVDETDIDTDYETETKSPTDEESGGEDGSRDICRLTPETGPCTTFLHQWYFNTASQSCKQFLYGGCGGNENRFETKEDCDNRCQREDVCALSPAAGSCAAQITMYYYDRATDRCLQFVYGGCGGNDNRFETREACEQRCHIRKPSVTGLAICSELADPGPCRASETKWHYDKETGECMEFTYGGCDGNTNRFDSKEQCQQSCPLTSICQLPADVGPCRAAKPRYFYDASIGDCKQFTYGGCSGNANRFLTIENCRKVCDGVPASEEVATPPTVDEETDVCSLKEDTGPCAEYQLLWHFDSESQACRQFWYGGCEGNGNKFETEEQCLSRCVVTESSTDPETGVATEQPTVDVDLPSTATEKPEAKDLCLLAQDSGPCADYQLLWYFESESQACRQFWYGGCDGNENRFENEEQCMARCVAATSTSAPDVPATEPSTVAVELPSETTDKEDKTDQNACALQKDEGEYCTGWELFWYFDNDEGECRVFYYGGCAGNDNRFPNEEDCVKQCKSPKEAPAESPEPEKPSDIETITTTEAAVRDETDDDYDICNLPATAGPCTDHTVKWFWDQSRERCDRFMYGGCDGNDNNFDSEDDCNAACGSGQTPPDRTPDSQDEAPVIVEQDDIINSVVGETVTLPCLTRGSPKPVVSWLRNGQPISDVRRMSTTPDGSLHIIDAASLDSATYTCNALNSAGSASHDYTLVVNVPGMIEDSDTTGDVLASVDDTVELPCLVTGSPLPTVRWSHNGVDLEVVGPHLHQLDTGLQIQGVRPEDAGGYVCEAWNGFGEPQRKQIIVRVEETVTATVKSANETSSYVIGQTIVLVCSSNVDSAEIKWMKDDQQLRPIGSRITFADGGQLVIASITKGDSGQYSCTAKTERQSATSSAIAIQVQVAPVWRATTPKPDALCVDKPWYANCQLIVEADMCNHAYFSVFCCKSCRDAGKLP